MNTITLVGVITILAIGILIFFRYKDMRVKKRTTKQRQDISVFVSNIEKYGKSKNISYPVYYINMDKNIDRKIETEKQLSKISNKITRIPGVNGYNIRNLHIDTIDGIPFQNEYVKMTRPELGCLLAHIKAIHTVYENKDEIAMICEDDIYTEPYKMSVSLEEIVRKAPPDWDWLQLYSGGVNKSTLDNTDPQNPQYLQYDHKHWSCVAYLIRRSGAEKLINILGSPYHIRPIRKNPNSSSECEELYNPSDYNFPCFGMADMWIPDLLNSYVVTPFPFSSHPKARSTIHEDHVDLVHIPALYTFFTSLNERLTENKKCVYVEKNSDSNFIAKVLPYYLTNIKDDASLIVTNILSPNHSRKSKIPKIIIDREPWDDSEMANADLVITTKSRPKHNLKFIYVPQYSFSFSEYGISPENLLLPKPQNYKSEFCAFVYSNCDKEKYKGVQAREKFFDLLQKASGSRVNSWENVRTI